MAKRHRYSSLLHTIDSKCDRILRKLDIMRDEESDSTLKSIKESARDIYLCSIEERRRVGKFFSVLKHD